MATDEMGEQGKENARRQLDQFRWEPTFRQILEPFFLTARQKKVPDWADPEFLQRGRDPGPDPPAVDGVSWSEMSIANIHDGYQIPVRVYKPESPSHLRPGYVLYHGGGLSVGHLNTEHGRCVELTKACGAVGISVDFRLAPDHPPEVILGDCYSVLKHITDNASDFDIDPRRIAITGTSAGGMATLAVAQMARDRKDTAPLMQMVMYPPTDDRKLPEYVSAQIEYPPAALKELAAANENLKAHGEDKPYIFPAHAEDLAGLCPAVIIIPQNSSVRDEDLRYATRLTQAGVATEVHVLPGVSHGFDILAPDCDSTRIAYNLMNDAFRRAAEDVKN